MRIDIKMPTLSKQRPTKVTQSFIEIDPKYLRYCVEFIADEFIDSEDESLGYESVFNFIDIFALKSSISGLEISNVTKPKLYCVIAPTMGFTSDIKIYFKEREKAQEIYDKIKTWLV